MWATELNLVVILDETSMLGYELISICILHKVLLV